MYNKIKEYKGIFLSLYLAVISVFYSCQNDNNYFQFPDETAEINFNKVIVSNGNYLKYNILLHDVLYSISLPSGSEYYLEKYADIKQSVDQNEFYKSLIEDENCDEIINDISLELDRVSEISGFDFVQVAISFVQSIPYDKQASIIKSPLKTLLNNSGDCDDKSLLLSKILTFNGYRNCLFLYKIGKHMAVGLGVDDAAKSYFEDFIFIESTGIYRIGSIPKEFQGSIDIRNETPSVIVSPSSDLGNNMTGMADLLTYYTYIDSSYGEDFLNSGFEARKLIIQLKKLDEKKLQLDKEIELLKKKNRTVELKINKFRNGNNYSDDETVNTLIDEFNSRINEIGKLVNQNNNLVIQYNKTVDQLNALNLTNGAMN